MAVSAILALIFAILLSVSEFLGSNPKIQANSIYQLLAPIFVKLAEIFSLKK